MNIGALGHVRVCQRSCMSQILVCDALSFLVCRLQILKRDFDVLFLLQCNPSSVSVPFAVVRSHVSRRIMIQGSQKS